MLSDQVLQCDNFAGALGHRFQATGVQVHAFDVANGARSMRVACSMIGGRLWGIIGAPQQFSDSGTAQSVTLLQAPESVFANFQIRPSSRML